MRFQSNRLLTAYAVETGHELKGFEHIPMPLKTLLFQVRTEPRYVHFMTSGMASIVMTMEDGTDMEVGLVGHEGCPEVLHLLGPELGVARCFIQMQGTALRMKFQQFKQLFLKDDILRRLVLENLQYEMMQLNQLSACNRLHEVRQRLARWLLMVRDRMGEGEIHLTQEFLGDMLGARRSSVTVEAGALQNAGLIEYKRGHVKILDAEGLESVACECYKIVHRMFCDLYKTKPAVGM